MHSICMLVENFSTIVVVWKSDCKRGFISHLIIRNANEELASIDDMLRLSLINC